MIKEILSHIDHIVDAIYSDRVNEVPDLLIGLIDCLNDFIRKMNEMGYFVDMNQELKTVSDAFARRDYIELADTLLDDIGGQLKGFDF